MARNDLRDEFPVLRHLAYLNAGTDGPLPSAAVHAAGEELSREAVDGRAMAHFERRSELNGELRAAYAGALGCDPGEVALTTCTSEGIAQVIAGLELAPGDEILTSDEEHPGLLGALAGARDVRGVKVRIAPLPDIADAVDPSVTRLVACSHVGWMSGLLAPDALAELDVPVLLDGAQGVGAIPVDVHALGCDAYAGAGQKWMCGPDGTGMLYVSASLRARLSIERRGYANLADPNAGLDAHPHEDARALGHDVAERRGGRVRAGRDARAGERRLADRARARARAGRATGRIAGRARPRRGTPRGHHARVVREPGPRARARAPAPARGDRA